MKQFFTWLVWSLMHIFGLSDYVDSVLIGIFVLIVAGSILLGIVYFILTFIDKVRKARIRKNEEDYRTRFVEICKELIEADSKVEFNDEKALFSLQVDNDTTVTYDPQTDVLVVKKNEDLNQILPDEKPGNLRVNLRYAGKETDAFANCELVSPSPSDNIQEKGLSWEVSIPREKLRKGQLADIKNAFERFEAEYCYVPVTSYKIYQKEYDLKNAFVIVKKTVKAVYKDAVVYHLESPGQNQSQFYVVVYVKRKDATTEKINEIKTLINDLPIGDNKKIILKDGSIMYDV